MHSEKKYTYLALGDSYTIGEMVMSTDSFPYQTVRLLNKDHARMELPVIVAKTGWTTDELETGIAAAQSNGALQETYDLVSLLIGVNNQYRGRSAKDYEPEFEALVKKAIRFAGDRPDHVAILSIPDWGVTPFAHEHDSVQIGEAIDQYNGVNRAIASKYGIHYIDITPWTREAAQDGSLLTTDGLHPSGKEYARWAALLASFFDQLIT